MKRASGEKPGRHSFDEEEAGKCWKGECWGRGVGGWGGRETGLVAEQK